MGGRTLLAICGVIDEFGLRGRGGYVLPASIAIAFGAVAAAFKKTLEFGAEFEREL